MADVAGSVLGTVDGLVVVVFDLVLGFGLRGGKGQSRRELDDDAVLFVVDKDTAVFAVAPEVIWKESAGTGTVIGVAAGTGVGGGCNGVGCSGSAVAPEKTSRKCERPFFFFLILIDLTLLQGMWFDRVSGSGVVVDSIVAVFRFCVEGEVEGGGCRVIGRVV